MAINLFQSTPNNIFQQQNPIFQNNTQSQQVIGSYRGQFKQIKLIDNSDRDELQSTNCYVQTEYKGISPMQVRLEDYYLIRSQQLQQFHKTQVERAYRNGNFNGKLLNSNNIQNLKPPTFPKSNDLFNSTNTIFNSNNNNNRQNNDLFQQTNTNIFANKQNNNIFNQSNTTMPSSNIFNSTIQSNNNIFSQSNNTNNIFSQNIFSNNQNSNIFNQQQPNNNLFQSQNIFQNPNIFQNAQSQINSYPLYNQPYLKYDYAAFQGVDKLQESLNLAQSIYLEIASFEQNQQQSQDQFDQMMRENTNKYQLYMPPTNKKSIKQGGILSKPTSITSQSTILHSKSQVNKTSNQVKKKISQFNDRECSYYNIQIEIEFLESEQTLSLMSEFQCRSKVHQVKQFVENHLLNIEVFGKQSQIYFDNCLIQNERGDEIDQTQPIAENKKIYFKYFIQKQPKLIRNEYQSNLSQYSDHSCVHDFTVWTQYGSVRWPSETNLLYVDLDKIIDINYEQIEVYDTKKIHPLLKPEIGNKLNKECFITFKFNFNKNTNKQKIEFNIQKQAQKQGLEYVSINFDQEVFTVKARHFSGYRFNSDYSSTDESCYRVPQHQVEVQTQEVEQCYEESEYESESLSIQIKDESNLQKKKQFDQCFVNAKNKNKQLNEQQINQQINYINNKFNKQIPLLSQKQKDQLIINIDVLEQYFHSNLLFDFKVNSQQTTAVLLNTLYQNKNPTDEIIRTFKLFNILFGSPSIDLVQFLELLYQEKIAFEDILTTSKQQKLRGLALSLFLEQFKMKHEQIDFREDCISQQKKFENLQNVIVTLNYRQNNNYITEIQKIDWIDCFTYWRLNKQQPLPLYQKDWWNALYNEMKTQNCSTPQFAALLYFLLKKTKQPQSEWKKLYDFFTKSSDSFSIILFHIISQRCKLKNQSLKIIGKSFIEKFISKQVSQELMNNLLISFEDKIFEKKEIDVIKNHISKHVFYYSQTIITGQKIHYYLNTQNFLKALETILIENKQNEYEQIMKNILIPYLILYSDRQRDDQYLIDLIKKVIQQMKNDDMSKICMMYLDKLYFDEKIIRNWIVCNDYQYHMKQLIVRMFNDEF